MHGAPGSKAGVSAFFTTVASVGRMGIGPITRSLSETAAHTRARAQLFWFAMLESSQPVRVISSNSSTRAHCDQCETRESDPSASACKTELSPAE
jgi:hypothetical protein